MAHVVISVSPHTKSRLDSLRDSIQEANGYKLSYSDLVKMLLKTYEDQLPVKDDRQLELDLEEDKAFDMASRYKK
tara:strand:+ start:376 stop:600 length:225 start_codon:yes stop_codon:yes gene_type:complete